MDVELATEIADEVYKLYPPDEDAAAKDLVWSVMDEGQRAQARTAAILKGWQEGVVKFFTDVADAWADAFKVKS